LPTSLSLFSHLIVNSSSRVCSKPIDRYSTRIYFDLTGELARRLDEIIQRGIVGSKPEAIRQALMEYFNKLDEQ
jgi:hypothetical protein